MKVVFDPKVFEKKLMNIAEYSIGFLDGIQGGKKIFLDNFGEGVAKILQLYIDSQARTDPQSLHHVYEWYQAGNPSARLFDIRSNATGSNISINATFTQSSSISYDSNEPFEDKARIMESGKTITIKPKNAKVLAFNVDGEEVFTNKEVRIDNPGGDYVEGSFKDVIDEFFKSYFTQSFLRSSGLYEYLKRPEGYKNNLRSGSLRGRSTGYEVGFRWITGARIGVE